MVQKSTSIYPALRDKLKPSLLPLSDITRALSGLSPDVAAHHLCECLQEEQQQRQKREKRTLVALMVDWAAPAEEKPTSVPISAASGGNQRDRSTPVTISRFRNVRYRLANEIVKTVAPNKRKMPLS